MGLSPVTVAALTNPNEPVTGGNLPPEGVVDVKKTDLADRIQAAAPKVLSMSITKPEQIVQATQAINTRFANSNDKTLDVANLTREDYLGKYGLTAENNNFYTQRALFNLDANDLRGQDVSPIALAQSFAGGAVEATEGIANFLPSLFARAQIAAVDDSEGSQQKLKQNIEAARARTITNADKLRIADPLQAAAIRADIKKDADFLFSDEVTAFEKPMEVFGIPTKSPSDVIADAQGILGYTDLAKSGAGAIRRAVQETTDTASQIEKLTNQYDMITKGDIGLDQIGELASLAGEFLINNPQAVLETTAQSLPSAMLIGSSNPAFVAAGAAQLFDMNVDEAVGEYKRTHGGLEPAQGDAAELALLAGAATAVATLGERVITKPFRDLGKAADEAGAVAKALTKTGQVVGGTALEGVSEASENVLVQLAGKQGAEDVDFAQAFAEGTLGAGSGGAIASTGALSQVAKDTAVKVADSVAKSNEARRQAEVDTSAVTAATDTLANADATPAEKATAAVAAISNIAELRMSLADQVAVLQSTDATSKENKEAQAKARAIFSRIQEVEASEQALVDVAKAQEGEVEAIVSQPLTQEGVGRMVQIAQVDPDSISIDQAKLILENSADQLSEAERRVFESFTQTAGIVAEGQNTAGVNDNIVNGGEGFMGIKDYRNAVYSGVLNDNPSIVSSALNQLDGFASVHQAKADLFTAAAQGDPVALKEVQTSTGKYATGVPKSLAASITKEADLLRRSHTALNEVASVQAPESTPVQSAPPVGDTSTIIEPTPDTAPVTQRQDTLGFTNVGAATTTVKGARKVLDAQGQPTERNVPQLATTLRDYVTASGFAKGTEAASAAVSSVKGMDLDNIRNLFNTVLNPNTPQAEFEAASNEIRELGRDAKAAIDAVSDKPESVTSLAGLNKLKTGVTNAEVTNEVTTAISTPTVPTAEEEVTQVDIAPEVAAPVVTEVSPIVIDTVQEAETDYSMLESLPQPAVIAPTGDRPRNIRQAALQSINVIKEFFNASGIMSTTQDLLGQVRSGVFDLSTQLPDNFFAASDIEGRSVGAWGTPQDMAVSKLLEIEALFKEKAPALEALILQTPENFQYTNYIRGFITEDGKLASNVINAMAVVAHNWLATDAAGTLFNNSDDIKRLLGMDEDAYLPYEAYKSLRSVGVPMNTLVDDLGTATAKVLGLTGKKTLSKANQTKLEQSLGAHAIELFREAGLLEEDIRAISNESIATWANDPTRNTQGELYFVKAANQLNAEGFAELTDFSQSVKTAEKESGSVVDAIFSPNPRYTKPVFSTEGIAERVPTMMKGTSQLLTDTLRNVITKHSKRPHVVKQRVHNALMTMTRNQRAEMNGYQTAEQIALLPAHKREGAVANNEAILRSLNHYDDFIAEMQARNGGYFSQFYFEHEVWRNLRMGMKSNTVNIQTDKSHRHLIGMSSEIQELSLTDAKGIQEFQLAMALAFDISTDKLTVETALNELNELIIEPFMVSAIASIKAIRLGGLSEADIAGHNEVILDAVGILGTNGHAYEALIELEAYTAAIEANAESFTTSIIAETDGVTNGPALGQFVMGTVTSNVAAVKERLTAAGFFFDNKRSFGAWKENKANLDMYQQLAKLVSDNLGTVPPVLVNFIGNFVNDAGELTKDARSFAKEPLTGNVYGQGATSVKKGSGNYGLDKVATRVHEEGIENWAVNRAKVESILKIYNGYSKKKDVTLGGYTYAEFNANGFPANVSNAIANVYAETYGTALAEAIESGYAGIKQSSSLITGASQAMFFLYEEKLRKAVIAKKQELEAANPAAFNSTYDELSAVQLAEVEDSVKAFLPSMDNYYSQTESRSNRAYALKLGKSKRERQASSTYAVDTNVLGLSKVNGFATTDKEPGVSGISQSIHSMDATIMYLTLDELGVTNIFDAVLGGILTISEASEALNRNTLKVLGEMSPVGSIERNFAGSFKGISTSTYLRLDKTTQTNIGQAIVNLVPVVSLNTIVLNEEDIAAIKALTKFDGSPMYLPSLVDALMGQTVGEASGVLENAFQLNRIVGTNHGAELIAPFKKHLAQMTKAVDAGKAKLLADLTYLTQYNKEGNGVTLQGNEPTQDVAVASQEMADIVRGIAENINSPAVAPLDESVLYIDVAPDDRMASVKSSLTQLLGTVGISTEAELGVKLLAGLEGDLLGQLRAMDRSGELSPNVAQFIIDNLLTQNTEGHLLPYFNSTERTQGTAASEVDSVLAENDNTLVGKEAIQNALRPLVTTNKFFQVALKTIPEFLKIVRVTPDTISSIEKETGYSELRKVYGVFFGQNTAAPNTIYLMGSDFQFSGTHLETIMHEIVHSIEEPLLSNLENNPEAVAIAARLEKLRRRLLSAPNSSKFKSALDNIHELVAWGTTNAEFMDWLKKQKGTEQRNAFSELIRNIAQYLFGTSDSEVLSAYEQLTYEASALIRMSQKSQQTIATNRTSPMPQEAIQDVIETQVTSMNSEALFDQLAVGDKVKVSAVHKKFLRAQLNDLVNKVLQPVSMTFTTNAVENLGLTVDGRILLAKADPDSTVVTTGLSALGFNMSAQEVYLNQLYNVVLEEGLNEVNWERNRMVKIYNHARTNMTPEMFLDSRANSRDADYAEKLKAAQNRFNRVFKPSIESGGADTYLREFMALALTNEGFRKNLGTIPKLPSVTSNEVGGVLGGIVKIAGFIIDFVSAKANRAASFSINDTNVNQIDTLAKRIARVDDSVRMPLLDTLSKPLEMAITGIGKAGNLIDDMVKKSFGNAGKATSKWNIPERVRQLALPLRNGNAHYVGQVIENALGVVQKGKLGFVGMLTNEFRGETEKNTKFHSMLSQFKHYVDATGQAIAGNVRTEAVASFLKRPTSEQSAALTDVLLRADMQALANDYSMVQMRELLSNEAFLQAQIAKVEGDLDAIVPVKYRNYYKRATKAMGVFMVTSIATESNTLTNPGRIANLHGMTVKPVPENVNEIATVIDKLGSLYALQAAPVMSKSLAVEVMNTELPRGDENGISFMLSLHKVTQDKAREAQFATNPLDFIKGYTAEITDPYTALGFSSSPFDNALLAQGYVLVKRLPSDRLDPNNIERYMYKHPNGGSATYNQGVLYMNNQSAKGQSLQDSRKVTGSARPTLEAAADFATMKVGKLSSNLAMLQPRASKLNPTYMVPTFDTKGELKDYRYVMSSVTRNEELQRNNDMFDIIGKMAADNHVIPASIEKNRETIIALKMQYDADVAKGNLGGYILLSPTSSSKEMKDAYMLLPDQVKQQAKELFGARGIPVRNDLFDVVFGGRKWTISELWNTSNVENSRVKELARVMLNTVFLGRAQKYAPQVGKAWGEVVSSVKDIVVNKSGLILLANITSNTNYLVARGLSFKDATIKQKEGAELANQFILQTAEIARLNLHLEVGTNKAKHGEYRARLVQLTDSINRNPVKGLIDAGLLPTISEGVETTVEEFGYKSKLMNKFSGGLDRFGEEGQRAIKRVLITQDSDTYKAMSRATQLSDFAARYALIGHVTTRPKNRLTKEEAIKNARQSFVNYDLPTHKAMEYASDIGILWFARYAIRMQRNIIEVMAENPARVTALLIANTLTGGLMPTVFGSLYGVANPLDSVGFLDRITGGVGLHPILAPMN